MLAFILDVVWRKLAGVSGLFPPAFPSLKLVGPAGVAQCGPMDQEVRAPFQARAQAPVVCYGTWQSMEEGQGGAHMARGWPAV